MDSRVDPSVREARDREHADVHHGCFVGIFSCFLNNAHIRMTSYIFA